MSVEGLVTSQYGFWTDASFVLISILMKRRELNLGFEDRDDLSPSTQCQDQILQFISHPNNFLSLVVQKILDFFKSVTVRFRISQW